MSTDGPASADERADDLLLLLRRASPERTPTTTTSSSSSSSASTGRQRYLNHLRLATSLDSLDCRSIFSAARSAVMGLGEAACAETRDDAKEQEQQQEEEQEEEQQQE
jgi:hypothetical protein